VASLRRGRYLRRTTILIPPRSKRRLAKAAFVVAFFAGAVTSLGRPEYFPGAIKFGAKDCSFCHALASGGGGHNERGTWLLAEQERRSASELSVEWLSERDALVDQPEATPIASTRLISKPPSERPRPPTERPFDYSTAHGDWPAYGGGVGANKYAPFDQIMPENLDQLGVAWIWEWDDSPDWTDRATRSKMPDGFKATPIMAGGRLFVRSRYSVAVALDPVSGETLWSFDPGTGEGRRPPMFGFTTRGLAYHQDASGARVLLLTTDGWLYALSPKTGRPLTSFGMNGKVDLTQGLRRELRRSTTTWSYPPTVCGNTVVIGNQASDGSHYRRRNQTGPWNDNLPLGDVRGFDARTGEQLWVFKTVPQQGEFGNNSWGDESWRWMGNTNVWSMTSCDAELGHVYLPVTAPTHHFYGGDRPGNNLFGTSVVALDARNGERLWHYQTVHHDIWDYDLPAAPVIADLVVQGQPVKAIAQVGKTGFLYVFDRITGKPIWPIEEKSVPSSSLAGERASPTQPFPTWPPPFEQQGLTQSDLIDLTPELRQAALETVKDWNIGPLFTPPSIEGTVALPGIGGGANWGGAAFDPETHMFYVASRRMPTLITAREVDQARFGTKYQASFRMPSGDGLPLVKPPWSSITAYQLDTGEIAWQIPNGIGPVDHPSLKGLDLPPLGNPGTAPGLLITRAAIFLGHWADGTVLRALDKNSGVLLWEHPIEGAHVEAPPMTYMADGQQFIVIGTGSAIEPSRLTAFRLP